jgi:tRNA (guanine-N7-)-methyltransferase
VRRAARLPPEQLAPYLIEAPAGPAPLDWAAVFGNGHPVEAEIGFGKGLFLLTASQQSPDVNFLGVEIERKYTLSTATRIAKRGLTNVRLACADAKLFMQNHVADGSLQVVHVYFPDPWWKKRHRKRRLFTEEFVAQCVRVLRPGGRLRVATDVEEYFGIMKALLAEQPRLRELPPPELKDPRHDFDYLTNFERKYRKQGKPIFRAAFELAEPPSNPVARQESPLPRRQ